MANKKDIKNNHKKATKKVQNSKKEVDVTPNTLIQPPKSSNFSSLVKNIITSITNKFKTQEIEIVEKPKSSKKPNKKKTTTRKRKTTAKSKKAKKTSKNTKEDVKEKTKIIDFTDNSSAKEKGFVDIPEYYDLPYRYNETIVKVLAQKPDTLFVYWDISDTDRENFEKQYGKDFFYRTHPVLVIHNLTDNYSFEVNINDFANNWYIHVNDAKCKYSACLGRRPNDEEEKRKIANDFLNISYSNTIEMPNDHVLFYKNHDIIYFKNIKTGKISKKEIDFDSFDEKAFKNIYKDYNLSDKNNRFDFKNPSSNLPSSNVKL